MALFKAENLTFEYPESKRKAIDNISLEIDYGEFVLLMGKTGSGKSTLLKHFVPSVAPCGKLDGTVIINSQVCYVPQNPDTSFVSDCVRGELAFTLENQALDNNTIALKIGEAASYFNLNHLLDRKISTLSGGERMSVAIASAIIGNAAAVILDEPAAQLDSKTAYELVNLLKRINNELGVTVIMSTHLSDGVIELCDRLIVLESGRIIFDDEPNNVNDEVLPFYPICAKLFDSHPLTVRAAVPYADTLSEKPFERNDKSQTVVELKNITFSYGKNERDVLDCLNFKAYKNKIHCIIGANASGKTTLLKIIAGIRKAYSGKVKVNGRVAYLPQNPQYLFTRDKVCEEIEMSTAQVFGLADYMDSHPYDLSAGQQQQLALAMLSVNDYDVLLLDEPSKSLDVFCKEKLVKYLKGLNKTIIIVSHDLDFVGDTADFVSFLSDGVITLNGDRREVLSSLDFYTTQVRRITRNRLKLAVAVEDLM